MQFLSGLNESYDQAKRQILMKSSAPSVNQAYALMVQDESQQLSAEKSNLIAMQVKRNDSYKGDSSMYCEHCHMRNHTKKECYKLVGYPSKRDNKTNRKVEGTYDGYRKDNNYREGWRKDRYRERYKRDNNEGWKKEAHVAVANNADCCQGKHAGNAGKDDNGRQYTEDNRRSDDKMSQLTKELCCSVNFFPDHCIFQDLYSGRVKGIGRLQGGLYIFQGAAEDSDEQGREDVRQLKTEVIVVLKQFFALVNTQFNCRVKTIRSDNDPGNTSPNSCPYTPQQNGVVERKHKQILEMARAIKFQASFPTKYWGFCIKNAVYLMNRLPSSALKGNTPYEILHHKKASLDHLRVPGCLCFVTALPKLDKFAYRSKEAALMGYSETQKGYIVLDLSTNKFFVSRDVVFHENTFPFSHIADSTDSTFLQLNHIDAVYDSLSPAHLCQSPPVEARGTHYATDTDKDVAEDTVEDVPDTEEPDKSIGCCSSCCHWQ
ncbi:uncharacterized protein LOC129903593 [Solanum dulcamara]|uniref:uncharacterized protein LOC129903593 n=1 Tax=Solanum dulcamara TaxID=45834 RepID=UPI0024865A10|nr:uncharacterized protein LOC129903593 [Solanum dulcamara]